MYPRYAPYVNGGNFDFNEVNRRRFQNHHGMNGPGHYPNPYPYMSGGYRTQRPVGGYYDERMMGMGPYGDMDPRMGMGMLDPRTNGPYGGYPTMGIGGRPGSSTDLPAMMMGMNMMGDDYDAFERYSPVGYSGNPYMGMGQGYRQPRLPALRIPHIGPGRSRRRGYNAHYPRSWGRGRGSGRGIPPSHRVMDPYDMDSDWEDYDEYDDFRGGAW